MELPRLAFFACGFVLRLFNYHGIGTDGYFQGKLRQIYEWVTRRGTEEFIAPEVIPMWLLIYLYVLMNRRASDLTGGKYSRSAWSVLKRRLAHHGSFDLLKESQLSSKHFHRD